MIGKRISKLLAPLFVIPLILSAGCSAGDDQACDGGKPIKEPYKAVQSLLTAAETNDYDEACSVIVLSLDKETMTTQLALLRTQAEAVEVTSTNFNVSEMEQGGSAHFYRVFSNSPEESLELTLIAAGNGYRIAFGE